MTGNQIMLQSTECFHMVHSFCIKDAIFNAAKRGEQPRCPKRDCGLVIQDFEIKDILNPDEFKDLQEAI